MIPLRDDQPSYSTPFINYFLIVLNVLVFLWELAIGFQSDRALNSFITQFAIVPRDTVAVLTGHAPATALLPFFTSMFLHGGFLHVAGNMLFLWIFGDNVEDYLGHFRYLLFYLVSGILSGLAQVAVVVPGRHERQRRRAVGLQEVAGRARATESAPLRHDRSRLANERIRSLGAARRGAAPQRRWKGHIPPSAAATR